MRRDTLQGRFFVQTLLLILGSLVLVSLIGIETLKQSLYREIENRQMILTESLAALFKDNPMQDPQQFALAAKANSPVRITLIDQDGTVKADSERLPSLLNNHKDRPEIRQATIHGQGISRRFSESLTEYMVYTAVWSPEAGIYIRTASSVSDIRIIFVRIYSRIILAGLGILVLAITGHLLAGYRLTRFFTTIIRISTLYARGDFTERIPSGTGTRDLYDLAESLNAMARQLKEKIQTINDQKNELKMMLDNIADPVILLNHKLMLRDMNPAAIRVFGKNLRESIGRSIIQVIPDIHLCELAEKAAESNSVQEELIRLNGNPVRHLQTRATPLNTGEARSTGVLIVLNDVTGLQKVNEMRRDFVSNVSHELKTPITAIAGYVETLESLAGKDRSKSEEFLQIIKNQTARLNTIVNELLTLSGLEEAYGKLELEWVPAEDLVASALSSCLSAAEKKGIRLIFQSLSHSEIHVNPLMAEQCLINLIENAIKYSDSDREVSITCQKNETSVIITVADQGWGIPTADLERIFERFYRVDKARSRELGGTGLGLSIVKHAMMAMGGQVTVTSEPGCGSEFRLVFPDTKGN